MKPTNCYKHKHKKQQQHKVILRNEAEIGRLRTKLVQITARADRMQSKYEALLASIDTEEESGKEEVERSRIRHERRDAEPVYGKKIHMTSHGYGHLHDDHNDDDDHCDYERVFDRLWFLGASDGYTPVRETNER